VIMRNNMGTSLIILEVFLFQGCVILASNFGSITWTEDFMVFITLFRRTAEYYLKLCHARKYFPVHTSLIILLFTSTQS